jgi:hypothetical protein
MGKIGQPQLPGGATYLVAGELGVGKAHRDRDVRSMQALISVLECSSAVPLPSSLPPLGVYVVREREQNGVNETLMTNESRCQ